MSKPDIANIVQMEAKMLMSAYGLVANSLICVAKSDDEELVTQVLNGVVMQFVSDIGLHEVDDEALLVASDMETCGGIVDEKVRVVNLLVTLFFKPFLREDTLNEFCRQVSMLGDVQRERLAALLGSDSTKSLN